MFISLSEATEPVDGHTMESAQHGRCNARPTVTFPAAVLSHCPWPVRISYPAEGRRLSWHEWLVTHAPRQVYRRTVTHPVRRGAIFFFGGGTNPLYDTHLGTWSYRRRSPAGGIERAADAPSPRAAAAGCCIVRRTCGSGRAANRRR